MATTNTPPIPATPRKRSTRRADAEAAATAAAAAAVRRWGTVRPIDVNTVVASLQPQNSPIGSTTMHQTALQLGLSMSPGSKPTATNPPLVNTRDTTLHSPSTPPSQGSTSHGMRNHFIKSPLEAKSSKLLLLERIISMRNSVPVTLPPIVLPCSLTRPQPFDNADDLVSRLVQDGIVRQFKLSGLSQYCLILTEDYVFLTSSSFSRSPPPIPKLATAFIALVLSVPRALSLRRDRLITDLNITDRDVTSLVGTGFLVMCDSESFWLSVRNTGSYIRQLLSGADNIVKTIRRRKTGFYTEHELSSRQWRGVALPTLVLIDYLVACNKIETFESPLGTMVRLVSRKSSSTWTAT